MNKMIRYALLALLIGHHMANAMAYEVYAGGVAGVQDFLADTNSTNFRMEGGNLYINTFAWGTLTSTQKSTLLSVFSNHSLAVALGFWRNGVADAAYWSGVWTGSYKPFGITPEFIAALVFESQNMPNLQQWIDYTAQLRLSGVPAATKILPTFEYQNFIRADPVALDANQVSKNSLFRGLIHTGGGIVLDTPVVFYVAHAPAYGNFVVDAIRWTREHGLKTAVILSPSISGTNFGTRVTETMDYLKTQNAMPDTIIVANYTANAPADYPNIVGNECVPYNILGAALSLISWGTAPPTCG
jgi:hypothetical protein